MTIWLQGHTITVTHISASAHAVKVITFRVIGFQVHQQMASFFEKTLESFLHRQKRGKQTSENRPMIQ